MSQPVRIAVLSLSGVVVVGLGILGLFQFRADQAAVDAVKRPESPKLETPVAPAQPAPPPPETKKEIWVHVDGAVHKPDVYQLPEGARVGEAIKAAGGTLPTGRPEELNLAGKLSDGDKLWVPSAAELKAANEVPSSPPVTTKGTVQPVRSTVGSTGATAAKSGGKVNVNTAAAKELEGVTGIGPVMASKIVAYRQAHGPFKSLDDLSKVSGIGAKTLPKIRDGLTL